MKISDVPMVTADEVEIKINSIVYDFHWDSGYGFKGEAKYKIRAYRVISVNESARHFRLRCTQGCESEHSFSKGCDRNKYYGHLSSIKEQIKIAATKDLEGCKRKQTKIDATKNAINNAWALAKSTVASDIKVPKAIKA